MSKSVGRIITHDRSPGFHFSDEFFLVALWAAVKVTKPKLG